MRAMNKILWNVLSRKSTEKEIWWTNSTIFYETSLMRDAEYTFQFSELNLGLD